jgi:hypothetical protein
MAEVEPDARTPRILGDDPAIERARALLIADPHQERGLEHGMAAMIRVIGHQPRSMVERLAHIGSEREHAHQQFTRRDKGRCPRHGGPQGIECLLHLALAPQHFAQQAQRRRIARRGAKALAQHGERLVQTPLAHGHGRAQQERIARSSLDALHFGLRSLPASPAARNWPARAYQAWARSGLSATARRKAAMACLRSEASCASPQARSAQGPVR